MSTFLGGYGSGANQLNDSYGIALDYSSNTIYISEFGGNRVMRYLSGAINGTVVAGGNGAGSNRTQLNGPFGIYFDSVTNSLVIANRYANNIVRWVIGDITWTLLAGDANGLRGSSSTLLYGPCSVTCDLLGNMFVADTFNHRIQLFKSGSTNGITIAGTRAVSGGNASLLYTPYAVKLDSDRNLYVADTNNHRVQKFIRQ